MTQEDIISNTRSVKQSLEALKTENFSILNGLSSSLQAVKESSRENDPNLKLMEEKINIMQKSIESIELGLGEAEVCLFIFCLFSMN